MPLHNGTMAQEIISRIKRDTRQLLSTRGGRIVAPAFWTAFLSLRRGPCLVTHRDEKWIHRYHNGTVVFPMAGSPSPSRLNRMTKDIWLWSANLPSDPVIVDIGAGIGSETATFSAVAGPGGKVIAVEAHPRTYEFLKANISANNLQNVVSAQVAVTDRSGVVRISDDEESHIRNTIMAEGGTITVTASTVDDLLHDLGIEHVDLLKMNIEGAEVGALQGAAETLTRTRYAYIACHDFEAERTGNSMLRTRSAVTALLQQTGFQLSTRPSDPRPWVRDTIYGSRAPDRLIALSEAP